MLQYRIYEFNALNCINGPPEVIEVLDDQTAIGFAVQRIDRRAVEVWRELRLVARLARFMQRVDDSASGEGMFVKFRWISLASGRTVSPPAWSQGLGR